VARGVANRYWADQGTVDSDKDGLSDEFEERVLRTNPKARDTDGDGLSDLRERDFGSNPLQRDSDGDLVDDYREVIVGTNPQDKDTDRDGVDDRTEIIGGTATPPDTDRDGTPDWLEYGNADHDRLDDLEERWLGTKPNEADSDFDAVDDHFEVAVGGTPRSPVDDFRRMHPDVEIHISEPLPDPPVINTPGGGHASTYEQAPAYDDAPSFEPPSDTLDQPSSFDGVASDAGDFV
jgi:Bacterial TSP3 repeat